MNRNTSDDAYIEACQAFMLALYGITADWDREQIAGYSKTHAPLPFALHYGEKYDLRAFPSGSAFDIGATARPDYDAHPSTSPKDHKRDPLAPRLLVIFELRGEYVVDIEKLERAMRAGGFEALPFTQAYQLDPERDDAIGGQHEFAPDNCCPSCGYLGGDSGYCDGCTQDMEDSGERELPAGGRFRVEQLENGKWACFHDGFPQKVLHPRPDVATTEFDSFATKRDALRAWLENNDVTHSPCGCCSHTIGTSACESGDHDPCSVCVPEEEAPR